jgi:hypothetical protein
MVRRLEVKRRSASDPSPDTSGVGRGQNDSRTDYLSGRGLWSRGFFPTRGYGAIESFISLPSSTQIQPAVVVYSSHPFIAFGGSG